MQDGQDIKHSERIVALQLLPQLEEKLREEVRGMGIDPEQVSGSCVGETFVGMVDSSWP